MPAVVHYELESSVSSCHFPFRLPRALDVALRLQIAGQRPARSTTIAVRYLPLISTERAGRRLLRGNGHPFLRRPFCGRRRFPQAQRLITTARPSRDWRAPCRSGTETASSVRHYQPLVAGDRERSGPPSTPSPHRRQQSRATKGAIVRRARSSRRVLGALAPNSSLTNRCPPWGAAQA